MARPVNKKIQKKVAALKGNTSYQIAAKLKISQSEAWRHMARMGINNTNYRPKKNKLPFDWID